VVEVADDAAVDLGELGEDAIEQAAVVHLREPRVESRPWIEQAAGELAIRLGGEEIVGAEPVHVLLDAVQRLFRHLAAVRQRQAEQLEPERRP
jgi:hypothetical protein